ncbi:3' exoribonuclease family, domain 1 [Nesidiocoris tenuis]|uniref:Exosome complex component RRP45 n=1 Tax=Nesidiocoris tenuis TaxID=355587 RepID=A0ABN7B9W3_9HEMI|nr:3' exoribonuclease family, domain 1 [Nesidiocoris tenuis]
MRDTIFAKCDSEFVAAAIKKKKRLDGRRFDELRSIELHFGSDFGCAYVTLGETKVLAQISCELSEPRNVRKNEGNLFVNVEIHDMVCGVFETGHHAHLAVHTNRLIEKCIKDSRCVDLEALCIVSEEQAWEIRVDVSVLNYDGNLVTCCSLAALAALAHFKTPHVTIENSEIRIDSIKEHEPEPLSLHHYPILVAFAIFGENDDILLDPTELEEKVCESELVIGMNSFNELCGMHFSGRTTSNRLLIVNASRQASLVAGELVKLVKTKLEIDNETRRKNRGKSEGLVSAIHTDRILSASQDRSTLRVTQREIEETARSFLEDRQKMKVSEVESDSTQIPEPSEDMDTEEMRPVFRKDQKRGVEVPPMSSFGQDWAPSGNRNAWTLPNATLSDAESDDDEDDVDFVKTITDEDRIIDRIELNDSEEEHDTIVLQPKELK